MVLEAYDELNKARQNQTGPRVAFYVFGKGRYAEFAKFRYVTLAKQQGLRGVLYHDESPIKENKPSAWSRMLEAIAAGQFDYLVVCQSSPELDNYCAQYNTKVVVINPFVM